MEFQGELVRAIPGPELQQITDMEQGVFRLVDMLRLQTGAWLSVVSQHSRLSLEVHLEGEETEVGAANLTGEAEMRGPPEDRDEVVVADVGAGRHLSRSNRAIPVDLFL